MHFKRFQRTTALAGLLLLLPSAAFAKAVGSIAVERVETKVNGTGREVVIHTSKEPTFSVFRLSDPFRVLVDINDARVAGVREIEKVNDGVVRYVSTNIFADEASAIVRVEIALEASAEYRVRAEGSSIVVAIDGPIGTRLEDEAPATASQSRSVGADESVAAKAAVVIGSIAKKREKGRTVLSARLESGTVAKDAIAIEQLSDPPRLVVHVRDAAMNPKWQRMEIDRFGVKRARAGAAEDGVRFVFDLDKAESLPQLDVDAVDGRIELVLSKAVAVKATTAEAASRSRPVVEEMKIEEPAVETAASSEEKIEAAVVAELVPQPKAAPAIRVKDVSFEPKDGFVRLTITLDGPNAEVEKITASRGDAPMLRVANAELPKLLERTLDVSEVAGDVLQTVSTYREGSDMILAAAIQNGTEHRHWKKGNKLMWDFRASLAKNDSGERQPTRVMNYGEQATSGFAASALSIPSTLMPSAPKYKGRRISLDLKDADIQNVLRLLADVSKLNIVAADDVKGKVTIKLRNVPWDQALDIILRAKGLDKTRNGNIIRIAPVDVLRKEEELRIERAKARVELEPLSVRLVPVSYAVASEVKPQVTALLSPRGKVNIDQRTNVLVVEDIGEVLLKVERLVRTLDTQTPQVLIEARIVEANTSFSRELGIQWGGSVSATQQYGTSTGLSFPNSVRIAGGANDLTNNVTNGVLQDPAYAVNLPATVGAGAGGALGFVFGSAGGSALISLRLSAAESSGKVKIISSPKVVTVDNKEARILSGEKVPITVLTANGPTTRFIDANLELGVTPHVTQDGSVLLNIEAKKNELSDREDNLGTPGILTKEAKTEMLVRDGDTAVLGGIYRRRASEAKAYVPFLGQIPVLGWLFKSTTKTDAREELLIFVTPRIVNRAQALVSAQ
jgi:type IV pilus assembly protein PilQ